MAAFTSTQTGNWSSPSTWGGSGPPTSGDTATIAATHVVTVDVSTVVGTGSGTAVTVNSAGTGTTTNLIIAAPFEVKGTLIVNVNNAAGVTTLTINAGQGITLNGSSSVTPQISFTNNGSAGSPQFVVNGSSGSHAYVKTKTGTAGNPGQIASDDHVKWNVNWLDCTNLGPTGTSVAGITINADRRVNQSIMNCIFTGCSMYFVVSSTTLTGVTMTLQNLSFLSSVTYTGALGQICFSTQMAGLGSGSTLNLIGLGFDKYMEWNNGTDTGITMTDIVYGNGFNVTTTLNGTNARWLYIESATSASVWNGATFTDIFYYCTNVTENQHGIGLKAGSVWTGLLSAAFPSPTLAGVGDHPSPVNSNVTLQLSIWLPIESGPRKGQKYWDEAPHDDGGAVTGIKLLHNTITTVGSTVGIGEGGSTPTNTLTSYEANLTVDSNYFTVFNPPATPPVAITADYNGRAGSGGTPYTSSQTGSSGIHDLNGFNPQYFDSTRGFLPYINRIIGFNTGNDANDLASGIVYMVSNPTQTITAMNWIRTGYRPTNQAILGTSYPGDPSTTDAAGNSWPSGIPHIGAMAYLGSNAFSFGYSAIGQSFISGPGYIL